MFFEIVLKEFYMTVIQGRRAARQLALLSLYQLEDGKGHIQVLPSDVDAVKRIIYSVAHTMTLQAKDSLERAAEKLRDASEEIIRLEFESPSNLATPMNEPAKPVPLPTTKETLQYLDDSLSACEMAWNVLDIPQLVLHLNDEDTAAFMYDVVRIVADKNDDLNAIINHYAQDWKADRMMKMDRLIMKLALAEILHRPDIDNAVSLNEAIELSKIYSHEDSHKFINGLLDKGVLQDKRSGTFSLESILATPEDTATVDETLAG
jgi:transcription antitermination protein NusB